MFHFSTREIALIGLGIALIAVCSWISIPMTVPFTLQTFAVCLVTALLGLKGGCWAVAGYILLGALGAPVFSGMRGGPAALLGTTGGYIVGFLLTAAVIGLSVRKFGLSPLPLLCAMAAGILLCYAFGTGWFMLVYARSTGPISLATALGWCVFPFLLPDAVKIILAAFLARRLQKALEKAGR